jgi:broad specificity polyphosphatase/5'/3'-nucleotidase SurE
VRHRRTFSRKYTPQEAVRVSRTLLGGEPTWERTIETDAGAVGRGLVSITPLNIDMTDEALLAKMRTWRVV